MVWIENSCIKRTHDGNGWHFGAPAEVEKYIISDVADAPALDLWIRMRRCGLPFT